MSNADALLSGLDHDPLTAFQELCEALKEELTKTRVRCEAQTKQIRQLEAMLLSAYERIAAASEVLSRVAEREEVRRKEMRVNVYAEEITDRVEIVTKQTDDGDFTGLRFYLELPMTVPLDGGYAYHRGPFVHRPGDDDSSAVTFWGKRDFRDVLRKALAILDAHYSNEVEGATRP